MKEGLIKTEDRTKRFGEDDDGRIFIEDLKQEPGFYIAEYTENEETGLRRLELRHKYQGEFKTDENGKVVSYTGVCICDIGRIGDLVYMCNTDEHPDVSLHGKTFVNKVLDPETGELEPSFLKVEGVTVDQNGNVIGEKDKVIVESYEHKYNPNTRKYEIQSLKNEDMGYSKTFSGWDNDGNPGYEAQYGDSGFVSESDILGYHTCPYTGKPTNVPATKRTRKPGMHETKDVFEKDSRIIKQEDLENGSKKYFSKHDANKRPWHEKFYDEDDEFLGDAEIKDFWNQTNMPRKKEWRPVGEHPEQEILNSKGGIIKKVDLVTECRTEFSGHDKLNRPTVEKEYDDIGKITKREVKYIDHDEILPINGKDVSVPEGGKVVVFNTYDLDEKYILKQGIYAEDKDQNTICADEWDEYGQRRILVYDEEAKVLVETSGRGDAFVINRTYVDKRKYPFLKRKVRLLIHEDLRDGTRKDISYTLRADGKTFSALETGVDARGRAYTRHSIVDGTGRYLESVCTINPTGRSSETLYSWEIEKDKNEYSYKNADGEIVNVEIPKDVTIPEGCRLYHKVGYPEYLGAPLYEETGILKNNPINPDKDEFVYSYVFDDIEKTITKSWNEYKGDKKYINITVGRNGALALKEQYEYVDVYKWDLVFSQRYDDALRNRVKDKQGKPFILMDHRVAKYDEYLVTFRDGSKRTYKDVIVSVETRTNLNNNGLYDASLNRQTITTNVLNARTKLPLYNVTVEVPLTDAAKQSLQLDAPKEKKDKLASTFLSILTKELEKQASIQETANSVMVASNGELTGLMNLSSENAVSTVMPTGFRWVMAQVLRLFTWCINIITLPKKVSAADFPVFVHKTDSTVAFMPAPAPEPDDTQTASRFVSKEDVSADIQGTHGERKGTIFEYDAKGNVVRRTKYHYDAYGKILSKYIEDYKRNETVDFKYDRVKKEMYEVLRRADKKVKSNELKDKARVVSERTYYVFRQPYLDRKDIWTVLREKSQQGENIYGFGKQLVIDPSFYGGRFLTKTIKPPVKGVPDTIISYEYKRIKGDTITLLEDLKDKKDLEGRKDVAIKNVPSGTWKAVATVGDSAGNILKDEAFEFYLFDTEVLKETKWIAAKILGKEIDFDVPAERFLANALYMYKFFAGLNDKQFNTFVKQVSSMVGRAGFEEEDGDPDFHKEGDSLGFKLSLFIGNLFDQKIEHNLSNESMEVLINNLLDSESSANLPTLNYRNAEDIGNWFWVFAYGEDGKSDVSAIKKSREKKLEPAKIKKSYKEYKKLSSDIAVKDYFSALFDSYEKDIMYQMGSIEKTLDDNSALGAGEKKLEEDEEFRLKTQKQGLEKALEYISEVQPGANKFSKELNRITALIQSEKDTTKREEYVQQKAKKLEEISNFLVAYRFQFKESERKVADLRKKLESSALPLEERQLIEKQTITEYLTVNYPLKIAIAYIEDSLNALSGDGVFTRASILIQMSRQVADGKPITELTDELKNREQGWKQNKERKEAFDEYVLEQLDKVEALEAIVKEREIKAEQITAGIEDRLYQNLLPILFAKSKVPLTNKPLTLWQKISDWQRRHFKAINASLNKGFTCDGSGSGELEKALKDNTEFLPKEEVSAALKGREINAVRQLVELKQLRDERARYMAELLYRSKVEDVKVIDDIESINITGGRLETFLKKLDAKTVGLSDFKDVYKYLGDNARENGFTIEDINKAADQFSKRGYTDDNVQNVIKKMVECSKDKPTVALLLEALKDKDAITFWIELKNAFLQRNEIITQKYLSYKPVTNSFEDVIEMLDEVIELTPERRLAMGSDPLTRGREDLLGNEITEDIHALMISKDVKPNDIVKMTARIKKKILVRMKKTYLRFEQELSKIVKNEDENIDEKVETLLTHLSKYAKDPAKTGEIIIKGLQEEYDKRVKKPGNEDYAMTPGIRAFLEERVPDESMSELEKTVKFKEMGEFFVDYILNQEESNIDNNAFIQYLERRREASDNGIEYNRSEITYNFAMSDYLNELIPFRARLMIIKANAMMY
ncbi:MAG: hypothetical protein ABH869_03605, partial [Candidatus Omnitrophota bacterium]